MSDDADLIRKMIDAWFASGNLISAEDTTARMARVLAVVRAHDAGQARRVPVQIVNMTLPGDASGIIIALASDGSLHLGQYADGTFRWIEQLSSLPQPGDEA